MQISGSQQQTWFFILLFTNTICNSMILPFMGFFLVEGLGHDPWVISVYSLLVVALTIAVNRHFARRIDRTCSVFPLVGCAALGYFVATIGLSVSPTLWAALSVGVIGFGLSASAVSTMFSLGGNLADQRNIARSRFNAQMRATTSAAWVMGPALSFTVADQIKIDAVFKVALVMAVIWLLLLGLTFPRDTVAKAEPSTPSSGSVPPVTAGMRLTVTFIFFLSLAHAVTFSSLPIFYVQMVGLPSYAPGLAYSTKTVVEIMVIFSTPLVLAVIGMRGALVCASVLAAATIQFLSQVQSIPQMLLGAAFEGLYYGLYASVGITYLQSFTKTKPASATALYWNTLMVSGLAAGPTVGVIAQIYDFQTVIQTASVFALAAAAVLLGNRAESTKAA